jgi:hypothetical protein
MFKNFRNSRVQISCDTFTIYDNIRMIEFYKNFDFKIIIFILVSCLESLLLIGHSWLWHDQTQISDIILPAVAVEIGYKDANHT